MAADLVRALLLSLILVLTLCACDGQPTKSPISELAGQTMGTTFSIKWVAEDGAPAFDQIKQHVIDVLARIDHRMSTWKPDSELSLFNTSLSTNWIDASAEFCGVVKAALALSEFTHGAFDITVGPLVNLWGFGPGERVRLEPPSDELIAKAALSVGYRYLQTDCNEPAVRKLRADVYADLSGYAKGYAVDQIAELLDEYKLTNYLVEVGGELRMKGNNASSDNWAIAIEKPSDLGRSVQTVVHLTNEAMATSGDYRNFFEFEGQRYSHTIDSRTGWPITHDAAAVTVVSETAAVADALATALLVLGPDEGFEFAERKNIAAYFLLRRDAQFEVKATEKFKVLLR